MKEMNFVETLGLACGDETFREELSKDGFQAAARRGAKVKTKDGEAFFDRLMGPTRSEDAVDVLNAMRTIAAAVQRACKNLPNC